MATESTTATQKARNIPSLLLEARRGLDILDNLAILENLE